MSYDFRLLALKSCLKSLSPPVSGIAKIFFRNALRRSSFASMVSSSTCLGATTAPMYFTKLIPHFSHFTPVRCLLPQEGQSKRIVIWQRWQKRATSRTAAPHFGQGIVAWGTGGAVGSHAFEGSGIFCREALVRAAACASVLGADGFSAPAHASGWIRFGLSVARDVTSGTASGDLPPFCPEDEFPVITHLNGDIGWIRVPRRPVRPRRYPVRQYRYLKFTSSVLGETRRNERRRLPPSSRPT